MRSVEEQLREISQRSTALKEKRRIQKRMMIEAAAAVICLILIAAAAVKLPQLSGAGAASAGDNYGSLILDVTYTGYVVIGFLSFLLGMIVTFLCINWRRLKQEK